LALVESRALDIFLSVIKTESTKQNYLYWLDRWLKICDKQTYDELLVDSEKVIQIDIENYLLELKKTRPRRAIELAIYPLLLFYSMNDVRLNEKRIKKMFPAHTTKGGGDKYSSEQVSAIINTLHKKYKRRKLKTLRNIAIFHLLQSTGIRIGAVPGVKLKDLTPIENCYAVKVYADTKDEYFTFTTPQARKAIVEYLEVTNDSTGLLFDISYHALRVMIYRAVKKADVRYKTNPDSKRYDIPMAHGLRKRVATALKESPNSHYEMTEKIIGHSLGLNVSYFKPDLKTLFLEYSKSVKTLKVPKHRQDEYSEE